MLKFERTDKDMYKTLFGTYKHLKLFIKKGEYIMNQITRKTKGAVISAALIMAVFLIGSNSYGNVYHSYIMRGQVLASVNNEIYLCIGTKDGARVGQTLDVYRVALKVPIESITNNPELIRNKIGVVKIIKIMEEHMAKATVISGKAEKYDIVELEIK